MSVSYQAVGWNDFKKRYDRALALGVFGFLLVFVVFGFLAQPKISFEILLMRAFGVGALILLHLILVIGPLARLSPRWLPLLYNRRHLGVTMFLLAFGHGMIALLTYHVGSEMNPILSVLTTDSGSRISAIPFQAFGLGALLILFVMAATSHDFWLANLSAPVWKSLHMMVYGAYLLLVAHVVFGVLQSEGSILYVGLISLGVVLVAGLHWIAGWREAGIDRASEREVEDGFVSVCRVSDLEENKPSGFLVGGERVAVLLYEGNKVNCVSGVCQHQNGPLAEGRFVYGCLTCPWHGYQYRPADGTSPEPFTEKIPTFDVRILSGAVWVRTTPNKAGTLVEPVIVHIQEGGTHE